MRTFRIDSAPTTNVHKIPKSSTIRKLLQAAVLASVLVPLGTVAIEATSITCGFGSYGGCAAEGSAGSSNSFDFIPFAGPYEVDLTFQNLIGSFFVTMTDFATNQTALSGQLNSFPGFTCVGINPTNTADPCVEFEVNAPPPGPETWTGFYDIFISWLADTNSSFPNDPGNRIRILHARGDDCATPGARCTPNGLLNYDTDITNLGSYCATCTPIDASIGGTDDNFQRFLVTQTPAIPEPTTLLLLGTGVSSLLYHRRRRRRDSGAGART
jgi:hypothetical protein